MSQQKEKRQGMKQTSVEFSFPNNFATYSTNETQCLHAVLHSRYIYSATRLTVATQQTFLQVNQSESAKVFDKHRLLAKASCNKNTIKWKFVASSLYLKQIKVILYTICDNSLDSTLLLYTYPQLWK